MKYNNRLSLEKISTMRSGKVMRGWGIGLIVVGILGFIGSMEEGLQPDDIAMASMFWGIGIILIFFSIKAAKRTGRIKQYLTVFEYSDDCYIGSIARAVGRSQAEAKLDVQMLISEGYLKNAYFNNSTGEVVFARNDGDKPVQKRRVTCPHCGGNSTIIGPSGECEYCGSMIE